MAKLIFLEALNFIKSENNLNLHQIDCIMRYFQLD